MMGSGFKWFVNEQLGLQPQKAIMAFRGIPRYLADLRHFRSTYAGNLEFFPCLHDRQAAAGAVQGEYFWQDLYVAQRIHRAHPIKHVDIGSRLDGFVAHVASFREIEVFDIRPLESSIPNVTFIQADVMNSLPVKDGYCDSLSCLHALEHFGLGRYGDPIDPLGWVRGMENMTNVLATGGTYYLSVPIGQERVEFNGHRVFNPATISDRGKELGLHLESFWYVINGKLCESESARSDFDKLSEVRYALGGFIWTKSEG